MTPFVITASIFGASGYSGRELLRILSRHPGVTLSRVFAHAAAGTKVADLYPEFSGRINAAYEAYDPHAALNSDVVFLALPSGDAMSIVPGLLESGHRIIDLGGDFRLRTPGVYERFYRRAHTAPHILGTAVYGLPEIYGETIRAARLVANPGCYPTSILLPLIPLLRTKTISPHSIAVASLSGVSGAGRSASVDLSFTEVNESAKAYKVGEHQHLPEIEQVLSDAAGRSVHCTFVPHLIPISRGILTTITITLEAPCSGGSILDAFAAAYTGAPFVRFSAERIPEIKHVVNTNSIDIGFRLDPDRRTLILLSAIDNLIKGAAGQAVQNMNLMFGFPETEALA